MMSTSFHGFNPGEVDTLVHLRFLVTKDLPADKRADVENALTLEHTGGGCTAIVYEHPTRTGYNLTITHDEPGGDCCFAPTRRNDPILATWCNAENEPIAGGQYEYPTLHDFARDFVSRHILYTFEE